MVLLPSLFLLLACLSGSFGYEDLNKKVFIFPSASKKAVVHINVSIQDPLTQFTVCLRFNPLQFRAYSLFSYSTKPKNKGFQITKPNPSQFNLQIGGTTQIIALKKASALEWQHICVAWNSDTGLVHFSHNGQLLPRFVMKKGYKLSQNGTIFLGHDLDSQGKKESFVGEMADVNMWVQAMKPNKVNLIRKNKEVPNALVSWRALDYKVWGDICVEEALHQVS